MTIQEFIAETEADLQAIQTAGERRDAAIEELDKAERVLSVLQERSRNNRFLLAELREAGVEV